MEIDSDLTFKSGPQLMQITKQAICLIFYSEGEGGVDWLSVEPHVQKLAPK